MTCSDHSLRAANALETGQHDEMLPTPRGFRASHLYVSNDSPTTNSTAILEEHMAEKQLQGLRVAILATDLFEEAELIEPRKALQEAGAQTVVICAQVRRDPGRAARQENPED